MKQITYLGESDLGILYWNEFKVPNSTIFHRLLAIQAWDSGMRDEGRRGKLNS